MFEIDEADGPQRPMYKAISPPLKSVSDPANELSDDGLYDDESLEAGEDTIEKADGEEVADGAPMHSNFEVDQDEVAVEEIQNLLSHPELLQNPSQDEEYSDDENLRESDEEGEPVGAEKEEAIVERLLGRYTTLFD